jgi:formate--tetrahydrofolate ligase
LYTYKDSDSIRTKIEKVCRTIYGAKSVVYTTSAEKKIKQIEGTSAAEFPVCIAKTQYSFSSDPKAYGVAENFEMKVRDIVINNGAGMIVAIMGDIMRMPGLPKEPQAKNIDIINGVVEGLS